MTQTKLIILDFDGTLGDTTSVIIKTTQATIKELHLPARTEQECISVIGLRLVDVPGRLFPECDNIGELYAETYRRLFNVFNVDGAVNLYPNVIETLQKLKQQGFTLTIASSRSHASLEKYIEKLGMSSIITYALGADDVTEGKPNPEPALKTLKDLKFKPEEAIVVGDTAFDILMGKGAGTKTCGVTYGNGTPESLKDADYIIDDFSELLEVIN